MRNITYLLAVIISVTLICSCGNDDNSRKNEIIKREDSIRNQKMGDSIRIEKYRELYKDLAKRNAAIIDWDTLKGYTIDYQEKYLKNNSLLLLNYTNIYDVRLKRENDNEIIVISMYDLDNYFILNTTREHYEKMKNKTDEYVAYVIKPRIIEPLGFKGDVQGEGDDAEAVIGINFSKDRIIIGDIIDIAVLEE